VRKIWNNANPQENDKIRQESQNFKAAGLSEFQTVFTLLPHGGATLAGKQKYPPSFVSIVSTTILFTCIESSASDFGDYSAVILTFIDIII
jgi:hypothetical protein